MSLTLNQPGLFGLQHSNRDFSKEADWGKNKFNNAFPAALACYMGSKGLEAIYICLDNSARIADPIRPLGIVQKRITNQQLFGLKELSADLFYSFEAAYVPYTPFVVGSLPRVDLVTLDRSASKATPLRGLEVKLTALPDNQTYNLPEDHYSCEIVVRPDTIVYLALSIAVVYERERKELFDLLNPICSTIKDWSEADEVFPKLTQLIATVDQVLTAKIDRQSPLLIQPVWKTVGKRSILSDNCFDLFVWSDFGFTRLFVDSALRINEVKRQARAVLWLVKMLYDFSKNGRFDHEAIFETMKFNANDDKAFSITGKSTYPYLKCAELTKPRISKLALKDIILGGGQNFLSPERRLDAAIVNTPGIF